MKSLVLIILNLFIFFSCRQSEEEGNLMPELFGDWVPTELNNKSNGSSMNLDSHPPLIGFAKLGFTFDSTGLVDIKRGYFKIVGGPERSKRRYHFLGLKTKYYVKGDSLKIFDLSDSTWWSQKIIQITKDTLTLSSSPGEWRKFVRKEYKVNVKPTFDKIIVSTSGCYGSCPVSNTMINSNGKVTFFGERYTLKTVFFEGIISQSIYQDLEKNFRKIDIDSISTNFNIGSTDQEEITVTFIKGDSIYKTISDYGNAGPQELIWAFIPFRFLYQKINLKPLPKTNLPFYPALNFLKFEMGKKELVLPQSESFLLWDYLRKGKISNKTVKKRFNLGFELNYTWFPSVEEENNGQGYNIEPNKALKEIITDGQLFQFLLEGKEPVTIDLGFNFFDRNYSIKDFKLKEYY